MKQFKTRLIELLQGLPTCRLTKNKWSHLSDSSEIGLPLYEQQERRCLDEMVGSSTSLPAWLTDSTGVLIKQDDHYSDKETKRDVYFFIARSNITTNLKKIAGEFTRKIFSVGFEMGARVGLIMWIHQTVLTITIDQKLYQLLTDGCDATLADYELLYESRRLIGNTIALPELKLWATRPNVPIQVFFGPRIGSSKVAKATRSGRLRVIAQHIVKTQQRVFVHGPYDVNLCDYNDENIGRIRDELTDADKIGCSGVVMHVGKNTAGVTSEMALNRMYESVSDLLSYASESCPLLIETPAGLGEEILRTIPEMIAFYNRFSDREKKRLGICVDTCHVWDAGYHPLTYLTTVHAAIPTAIRFVHFNDSKGVCGCAKDRHFGAGGGFNLLETIVTTKKVPELIYAGDMGYIGVRRMAMTGAWIVRQKIPAVSEGNQKDSNKDV